MVRIPMRPRHQPLPASHGIVMRLASCEDADIEVTRLVAVQSLTTSRRRTHAAQSEVTRRRTELNPSWSFRPKLALDSMPDFEI